MYELTSDPDVVKCTETGASIPRGHRFWDEYQSWVDAGNTPGPIPLPYQLYTPEHFKAIRDAAWAWMTAEVVARRYDSIETCVGYYNSTVPRYRAEARAMVAWRDAVNLKLEELVTTLPPGIETWEQAKALLPAPSAFAWPELVSLPLGGGDAGLVLPV